MNHPKEWHTVLDSEMRRWSAKSWEQLVSELRGLRSYEVNVDSKRYQVEVELVEDTETLLHVMLAVDDGGLPGSLLPLSQTFIREKLPRIL
jgi:hypothetical protein